MTQQKQGTPGGASPAGTEATNIQPYMKGCTFPCGRQDIIKQAEKNNAPKDVVERLRRIPDQRFKDENEVREVFGRFRATRAEGREAVTPGGRGL